MPRNIGPSLSALKADAVQKIDTAAGEVRAKYLTIIPGQSETYMYKLADCQQYIADGYPANVTAYPWVDSESLAQGKSAADAADFVVATYLQWRGIGIQIEQLRITGKNGVRDATTIAGVCAARNTALTALAIIAEGRP